MDLEDGTVVLASVRPSSALLRGLTDNLGHIRRHKPLSQGEMDDAIAAGAATSFLAAARPQRKRK